MVNTSISSFIDTYKTTLLECRKKQKITYFKIGKWCDIDLEDLPFTKGIVTRTLIIRHLISGYERTERPRFLAPIYLPTEYKNELLNGFGKVYVKIFLLNIKNITKWEEILRNKRLTYEELLDYIEKTRVKDVHKQLRNKEMIWNAFQTLEYSIPPFNRDKYNYGVFLICDAREIIYECNRLLQLKIGYPDFPFLQVNHAFNWMISKKIPCCDALSHLNRINRDSQMAAFDDFFYTLYDDLFLDMIKHGKFGICAHLKCHEISQSKLKYCDRQCGKNAWRHKYYLDNREDVLEQRKQDYLEDKKLKERLALQSK